VVAWLLSLSSGQQQVEEFGLRMGAYFGLRRKLDCDADWIATQYLFVFCSFRTFMGNRHAGAHKWSGA